MFEYIYENEWEEIITSSHHTKNKRKPPTLLGKTFNGGLCVYLYILRQPCRILAVENPTEEKKTINKNVIFVNEFCQLFHSFHKSFAFRMVRIIAKIHFTECHWRSISKIDIHTSFDSILVVITLESHFNLFAWRSKINKHKLRPLTC